MIRVEEAIVQCARKLYARNMLAACDGNISVREGDEIIITPSGRPKADLAPEDMARLSLDGQSLSGRASSEKSMHLAVYQHCPKAKAVVHAHPPTAIAWSIARPDLKELPSEALSEVILAVGAIPFVPYARPGTDNMGQALLDFIPQHRALILSRHGALSWGESLEEAYLAMERIEHSSQILKSAQELGGISKLPAEEVAALRKMREQMGERSL